MKFQSVKVYDGFSTCFRQWPATTTHCQYLHGYGVSVQITFEGELDHRNWVFDFGGAKRAINKIDGKNPKEWLHWLLDHTVIISSNDPLIEEFKRLEELKVVQLRVLPQVGAEMFARYIFCKFKEFITKETNGRVQVKKVMFKEHDKNSASYGE